METADMAAAVSDSIKEKQEEMLEVLEALRGRIRKLLDSGRLTHKRKRQLLAFMEMEVSALVESQRLPPPPWTDCDGRRNRFLEEWMNSIQDKHGDITLTKHARKIDDCLDKHGNEIPLIVTRPFRRRKQLGYSLSEIHNDASELYQAAEQCCGYEVSSSDLRPQAAKACDLVGIDGPAKKLLRCLTPAADDDKSLRVMCIVGPIGVGKTTLAMELHRRLRCQTTALHFQCCAAASFSRSSDRCSLLLQSILSQFIDHHKTSSPHNSEIASSKDPKLLAHSISEGLQHRRYLILIDGICNDSDWEIIKCAFPNNNCSSQMLITTRDELMIRTSFYDYNVEVHNMKPLINDSDSQRLLRIKAFGSIDDCPPDNLKLLCDEILRKCKGIPLFIIGLADWLKQHQQEDQSSAVHRSDQVHLLLKQFRQILSFEYDAELRLPLHYLSMFPQGRVFAKRSLLWRETDVKWFKIFPKLVDKNIITPVAENNGLSLNVNDDESCQWQVNPFLLHLFASKAAETGFVFTSTTLASARGSSKMTQIARRLALHHPDPQLPEMLQEMDLSQTRSLLISGAVDRISIPLDKFVYLVVLDLEGWDSLKDEDLLQICRMFMLRYLSIRNTKISKLPPQIKELRSLRTLDISHTLISELPSEVLDLFFLEVLDLRGTKISQLPQKFKHMSLKVLGLRDTKISQLPEEVDLFYLEVLDLRGTKISQLPDKYELDHLSTLLVGDNGVINSDETAVVTRIPQSLMKRATYLERLATIDLSECSASFLEDLGHNKYLTSLAITWSFHQCSDGAYQNILISTIQKLKILGSLTIHCGLGCSMELLGSLNHPPKQLNKLKVTAGRFISVPRWIGGLERLTFLQITICRLVPDDVNILANLKKLERLVLGLEFIPEEEIVIEWEGFKELERFCLDCPVPLLTFKQGAMPKLQLLQLKICSGPTNHESVVPSGLTNLRSITDIVICYSKWCNNSSSIKRTVEVVRKQVATHPNKIDLVINGRLENDETAGSTTKNECGSEDVEAFGEEAESRAECSDRNDDFDAADEKEERRAKHIQSEIEEVECETEIHA